MNNPVTTRAAEHWTEQVQTWKLSGLSQVEFCKRNELVYHQFIYWRAKIEGDATAGRRRQPTDGGFARVNVQPALVDDLTLSLPKGFVFRGINAANVSVVRELLEQLR